MLWYKAWLETRWRFLIGLVLLMLSACGIVVAYPSLTRLMSAVPQIDAGGLIGREIRESLELARDYRGYIWSQWYRQNLIQMWTLFAILLGSGSVLSQAFGGGTLFTLSLPASRARLVGIRAATGLAELLALAVVPSLLIPLFSPAVGQSYGVGGVLVHGACLFIAGAAFFSLTFLLSTLFGDPWRPLMLACAVAFALSILGQFVPEVGRYSLFTVMNGDAYFRGGGLPWLGLLASAALSTVMLYAANRNIARQDF